MAWPSLERNIVREQVAVRTNRRPFFLNKQQAQKFMDQHNLSIDLEMDVPPDFCL